MLTETIALEVESDVARFYNDAPKTDNEIELPTEMAWVHSGQTLSNREISLKTGEGGGEIALGHLHVADAVMRDGEVALPARVAGVGLGEVFADFQ